MPKNVNIGCVEKMEALHEFKYLGSIPSKHGSMDGEVREKNCAREESGWISGVYDKRKDSKYWSKKELCNSTDNYKSKQKLGVE